MLFRSVTNRIGDDAELKVRGQFGSYNERDVIVSAKTPLGDHWGVGFAIAKYDHDGYGTNTNTGADNYNKDMTAARLSVDFAPTDDLFFRLSGDWIQDDSNIRNGHREMAPIPSGIYDTAAAESDNEVVTRGVSLTGQWNYSDTLTFKSITAYRSGHTDGVIDFDSLPAPTLDIPAHYGDHQFSQEFQALISHDRLNGVIGYYYLSATAEGAFDTVVGNFNLTTLTLGYVDTTSHAFFADFSYDVTDQLQVSVGGRYTHDEKEGHVFRRQYLGIRSPYFGNAAAVPLGIRTDYTDTKSWGQFTPRLSVSYKFTPDVTGYASWSKGFKSGGFDMRGDAVAYPDTVKGYDPETVTSTEVGLKGSLFDHRLSFATDIFLAKYKDQQITTQIGRAHV